MAYYEMVTDEEYDEACEGIRAAMKNPQISALYNALEPNAGMALSDEVNEILRAKDRLPACGSCGVSHHPAYPCE